MITNIALKNFLINTVFRAFSSFNKSKTHDDRKILLYSDLGFRDNIKALYDYIIESETNENYEVICAVSDYKKYGETESKNVRFVSNVKGIFAYFSAGHVYYCFGRIPIIPGNDQKTVQMWHGTSFKGFDKSTQATNTKKNQFYTAVYASSDFFVPIVERKFSVPRDRVAVCGHPRTDVMLKDSEPYQLTTCRKRLIWLPTFRKSSKLTYAEGNSEQLLPILKEDEIEEFDRFLQERDVRIIVKIHPMQDVTVYDRSRLKNIVIVTNDEFSAEGYELYRMMKQTDALITDYSSVFYDYLLLDRPIGFTEDDFESYGSSRGFAVDDPDKMRPGMKIRDFQELCGFIETLLEGKDEYKQQRHEINDLVNKYQDGENAKRSLKIGGISTWGGVRRRAQVVRIDESILSTSYPDYRQAA